MVRGPTPSTVSVAVVLPAESAVRDRSWDLGLLSDTLQALQPRGWQVSWEAQGQADGYVLQTSRALVTAAHWPGPGLGAAANLSPIPTLAT